MSDGSSNKIPTVVDALTRHFDRDFNVVTATAYIDVNDQSGSKTDEPLVLDNVVDDFYSKFE